MRERCRCSYWLGARNALALKGAAIQTRRRDSSETSNGKVSGAGNRILLLEIEISSS